MKHSIAGLAAAALMLLSAMPIQANAADLFGDINHDGTVNVIDAAKLLSYSAMLGCGMSPDEPGYDPKTCDLDQDGDINARDAAYISDAVRRDAVTDGESAWDIDGVAQTTLGCTSKPKFGAVNDSSLSIRCPEFTAEDLEAWDYHIPVVIVFNTPSEIAFCEFGVESELPIVQCPQYSSSIDSEWISPVKAYIYNAYPLRGTSYDRFAWFAYADYRNEEAPFYSLLDIKAPRDFEGGEHFNIRIVSETETRRAFFGQFSPEGDAIGCSLLKGGNIDVVMPEGGPLHPYADIDEDGTVSVSDVILLQKYVLGNPFVTFSEKAADLNEDGSVDVFDLALAKRKLLGVK